MQVSLGRYPSSRGEFPDGGKTFFGADALYLPEHRILGVADSWHHYHLYPISERDVQAAFDIVRNTLIKHAIATRGGVDLLQELLLAVHRGLTEIDLQEHIAGIDFKRIGLSGRLEPADDPEAEPIVHIILAQLHRGKLSIASVGNFLVYVMGPEKKELVFGSDWITHTRVAVTRSDWAWLLAARSDRPEICSHEVEVNLGDLIVIATPSLVEVIALAKLDQFVGLEECNPEAVSRHLMTTLRSMLSEKMAGSDERSPYPTTSHLVNFYGAAWAVTYAEEEVSRCA